MIDTKELDGTNVLSDEEVERFAGVVTERFRRERHGYELEDFVLQCVTDWLYSRYSGLPDERFAEVEERIVSDGRYLAIRLRTLFYSYETLQFSLETLSRAVHESLAYFFEHEPEVAEGRISEPATPRDSAHGAV